VKTRLALLTSLAVLPLTTFGSSALAAEPASAPPQPAEPASAQGEPAGEAGKEPERRLAVAEAERSITFGEKILAPELDFDITHMGSSTYANLALVAGYGLTNDLNVRATILPLQLAAPGPSAFRYGQPTENVGPSVGATYRIRTGKVELGGNLDFGVSAVPNSSGIIITPGVPVRIHLGEKIRIDTGVSVPISRLTATTTTGVYRSTPVASDTASTTGGLNIPASILYDITEPLHIGVSTAFMVMDVSRWSATSSIPASIYTGYAIAGKDGPILDIDPILTFPTLLTPGASPAAHADYFVGLALEGWIYL